MNRGEVWWVNFEPSLGGEIKKQRPAIIVSNDISNKYLNRVQVVPVTSSIEKLYPSEAYITVNGKQNKAMCDQVTTVSKFRLTGKIDEISPKEMSQIDKSLKIQLGLL